MSNEEATGQGLEYYAKTNVLNDFIAEAHDFIKVPFTRNDTPQVIRQQSETEFVNAHQFGTKKLQTGIHADQTKMFGYFPGDETKRPVFSKAVDEGLNYSLDASVINKDPLEYVLKTLDKSVVDNKLFTDEFSLKYESRVNLAMPKPELVKNYKS